MLRIGFFGTPVLAAQVLAALIDVADIDVRYAVTRPDAPVGRKQVLTPSPVKRLAEEKNIPVFTPEKIKNNTDFLAALQAQEVDYLVVVAYGKILPKSILDLPKILPINVHGSRLPEYRGASPIQESLLQGDTETAVTIMVMSEGMDEGDILSIVPIPILPSDTSETLFARFGEVSPQALINTLREHANGNITPTPQDHANATYCSKIEKSQGNLDFGTSSAEALVHKFRAYTPWPSAYTFLGGKRLVINACHAIAERPSFIQNGEVYRFEGQLAIACLEGSFILDELTPEGGKRQTAEAFVRGNGAILGSILPS